MNNFFRKTEFRIQIFKYSKLTYAIIEVIQRDFNSKKKSNFSFNSLFIFLLLTNRKICTTYYI
jgi:hypothetical protein